MRTLKSLLLILLWPLLVMAQPKFIISGNGNSFTAKDESETVIDGAENKPIQDVIEVIRGECEGGCEIQFGNSQEALDIGNYSIKFENNWGEITLTGDITSNSSEPTISINNGISVISKANIKKTNTYYSNCAISNGGKIIISEGNIEAKEYGAICNHYTDLTINGGNIKAGIWGAVINDADMPSGEKN